MTNEINPMGSKWTVDGYASTKEQYLAQADGTINSDGNATTEEIRAALNQVNDSLARIERGEYFSQDIPEVEEAHKLMLANQKHAYESMLGIQSEAAIQQAGGALLSGMDDIWKPGPPAQAPAQQAGGALLSGMDDVWKPGPPAQAPAQQAGGALLSGMDDVWKPGPPAQAPAQQSGSGNALDSARNPGAAAQANAGGAGSVAGTQASKPASSTPELIENAQTGGGRALAQALSASNPGAGYIQAGGFLKEHISKALESMGSSGDAKTKAVFAQILEDINSGKLSNLRAGTLDQYSMAYDVWTASGGKPEDRTSGAADLKQGLGVLNDDDMNKKVSSHLHDSLIDGVQDQNFNQGKGFGLGDVAKFVGDAMWRSEHQPGSRG